MKPEVFTLQLTAYEVSLVTIGLECLARREQLLARIAVSADNFGNAAASQIVATDALNLIETLTVK